MGLMIMDISLSIFQSLPGRLYRGALWVSQRAASFCAADKAIMSTADTSVGAKAISAIPVSTFSRDRG